jgi:hypothetical protein
MLSPVLYTVQVGVNQDQLEQIIKCLNKYEIDEDETELTIEEVKSNPNLLKYLCEEAVVDGVALYDPFEFWNNDGWCDFKDYR